MSLDSLDLAIATLAEHERLIRKLMLERRASDAGANALGAPERRPGHRFPVPGFRRSASHR